VAKVLGYLDEMTYGEYYVILHKANMDEKQDWHTDMPNKNGLLTKDCPKIKTGCDGFSSFISLTNGCKLNIANKFSVEELISDFQTIDINKGDCLIVPNGVFHAGTNNNENYDTMKIFNAVGKIVPQSDSQVWCHIEDSDLEKGLYSKKIGK